MTPSVEELCPYCGYEAGHNEVCITREIERLQAENERLSAELRERIESEPLRYAQITQQFRSTVEYAATLIEERDHLTAQLARQQRVIERYRKDLARIEENDCPCGDMARAALAEVENWNKRTANETAEDPTP